MLENIKKVDKKILIMGGMMLCIILIFVIAVIIVSLTSGGNLSFEKIEGKLETAAENYLEDNDDKLPKEVGKTIEIDSTTLVSGGYIKKLSEYTDDDVSCSAKVIVGKNFEGYDYVASLDCGEDYKTEFLADKLISEVVTSGNGLYKMEDVVKKGNRLGTDSDGYDLSSNELMSGYIFRGDNVKNFVEIDEELYRIVKIDGNNDFTLISDETKLRKKFDDRYNSEIDKDYGFNNYTISRAYEYITDEYEDIYDDSLIKTKVASKNICIGGRNFNDGSTDGSAECSKVMKNQYYSLVPIFDVLNASLSESCNTMGDEDCRNYNYLIEDSYWTQTPNPINSYSQYIVSYGFSSVNANKSYKLKYVVYLSNRLVFESGTGTEDDPYIVR